MKLRVLEARFAESVKLSNYTEEIYINVSTPKHQHYEMFRDSVGMLWIHDKIKDDWVGTSTANLRSIKVDKDPFGEIQDEVPSGKSIQRANKTGEVRKA